MRAGRQANREKEGQPRTGQQSGGEAGRKGGKVLFEEGRERGCARERE